MKTETQIRIPWVSGPSEPFTEGENHRTVNIRIKGQSISVRCPDQKSAHRLKGRLIAVFQEMADNK